MINHLKKFWTLYFSFIVAIIFFVTYYSNVRISESKLFNNFQAKFKTISQSLDNVSNENQKILLSGNIDSIIRLNESNEFQTHIYKNDSLIYWSTNQIPVQNLKTNFFPKKNVYKLNNGWYYTKYVKNDSILISNTYIIKNEYQYENDILQNKLNPDFGIDVDTYITTDLIDYITVSDHKNHKLFSIEFIKNESINENTDYFLFVIYILFISLLFLFAYKLTSKLSFPKKLFSNTLIVLFFFASLKYEWTSFLSNLQAFQPDIYASSEYYPNFGNFIINTIATFYFIVVICRDITQISRSNVSQIVSKIALILSSCYLIFISYLINGIIENSNIPLDIDDLFNLNGYSYLVIISIGFYYFAYFIILYKNTKNLLIKGNSIKSLIVINIIATIIFVIAQNILNTSHLIYIWIIVAQFSILLFSVTKSDNISIQTALMTILCFSISTSINFKLHLKDKELQERELYANQLASDRDIETELEFVKFNGKFETDSFLSQILNNQAVTSSIFIKEVLDKRYFKNFWERYETEFFLFNKNFEIISSGTNTNINSYKNIEDLISLHTNTSNIDSTLYFVKDYTSQYSYLFKKEIYDIDSSTIIGTIFGALKSKKIPESIGYPKLLISNNVSSIASLDKYSIAKYYDGKLVYSKGSFSFPLRSWALTTMIDKDENVTYWESDGFSHYLLKNTDLDIVVISKQNQSTISNITSISVLFSLYSGLVFIVMLVWNLNFIVSLKSVNLSLRIQIIVIFIILLSLLTFSLGSGIFVSKQYYSYSEKLIQDKIRSIVTETQQEFSDYNKLERNVDLEKFLQKISTVYTTDINLYNNKGYLISSSRPKVYSMGLISTQINPTALNQLIKLRKSEYIHLEKIGNQEYSAAYSPIYNSKGTFLAYLNLQYFGHQEGYEKQIQEFLLAIINVFTILLTSSIIFALLLASWVTSPLQILRKNFSKVQFGKHNHPIKYESNDEIGALVKEYNKKLDELSIVAQQLAISERESAWREMAKQVAHEIKNPLTPMKLSLQHLQRIFDPNDPNASEKINKVVNSLVEQIDTLAGIANEFSNFAKMPKAEESEIDFGNIIENVIQIFKNEEDLQINFSKNENKNPFFGDRNLFIRVFNNIIQNAYQAKRNNQNSIIDITLKTTEKQYEIIIQDNGTGISDELKDKLFEPYFTTKNSGTGLGLAMVKQIIDFYNGTITFESIIEKGSIFKITLPKE